MTLGKLSAEIFDRIIVKEDDDTRGRPPGEAAQLIVQGILESGKTLPYTVLINETEAVNTTLDQAPASSLVVILPETVSRAIGLIEARHPKPHLDLPQAIAADQSLRAAAEASHPIHNISVNGSNPFQVVEVQEGIKYVQSGS